MFNFVKTARGNTKEPLRMQGHITARLLHPDLTKRQQNFNFTDSPVFAKPLRIVSNVPDHSFDHFSKEMRSNQVYNENRRVTSRIISKIVLNGNWQMAKW